MCFFFTYLHVMADFVFVCNLIYRRKKNGLFQETFNEQFLAIKTPLVIRTNKLIKITDFVLDSSPNKSMLIS